MSKVSIYISYLLRHHPEEAHLEMDEHGWVNTQLLIDGINQYSQYKMNANTLEEIVRTDEKGRYIYNEDHSKIRACQGHSVPWVIPHMTYPEVPDYLYHGTNTEAVEQIVQSGAISKMKRHAVHMQADVEKAWKSAMRWKKKVPVVLMIDARQMVKDGYKIGKTDNDVWCVESVPIQYIISEQRAG